MLVVTNPGSNLSAQQVAHYGIILTGQHLLANGREHDTRAMKSVREVDALVMSSKEHPRILGTSSSEFAPLFRELAKRDSDLLVVTTSRKFVGSYDAAVAAVRTLKALDPNQQVRVYIVDSTTGDLPAGMLTLFCAEAAKMGKTPAAIADAARVVASTARLAIVPVDVDYLAKSGRASFVKALAANMLQRVPFIEVLDGEFKSTSTLARSENRVDALIAHFTKIFGKGQALWVSVVHGDDPAVADELMARMKREFDVRYAVTREISPAVYLALGPRALALGAYPVNAMPWKLTPAV